LSKSDFLGIPQSAESKSQIRSMQQWLRRKSFPSGSLQGARIEQKRFFGDFSGTLPLSGIEPATSREFAIVFARESL